MEIRIGIVNAPREVAIEMANDVSADDVMAQVNAGVAAGGLVWLEDKRGRKTGFPADRLAYIELGIPGDDTRIGFG